MSEYSQRTHMHRARRRNPADEEWLTTMEKPDAEAESLSGGSRPAAEVEPAAGPAGGPLSPHMAANIESARGGGSALDATTRGAMEGAFGTSFAGVRIHDDARAEGLNRGIGALAFTTSSDIFFRQGTFQPESSAGRQLLAHELTHVVQQRGISGSGPLTVGPAGDSYEQQADAAGAAVAAMTGSADASVVARDDGTARLARAAALQRDDTPDPSAGNQNAPDPSSAPGPTASNEALETRIDLSVPEPVAIPADAVSQPGDYELPKDPSTVMAKRIQRAVLVQRDDDTPHPSADAQNQAVATLAGDTQAPWALQATAIYRNLNLAQIKSLHLDIIHEPQASIILDSKGALSSQLAITLINEHIMPAWNHEIEVALSAYANNTLIPKLNTQYGAQLEVEQHIVPWFSVTLNASGYETMPRGGKPGQLGVSAGPAALFHF